MLRRRMDAIDRITADDAVALATDVGRVPMQVGAVLVLDGQIDAAAFAERLAERLPTVPRLRQRLQPVPLGAGRAIWVDHARFVLAEHLEVEQGAPLDDDALLDLATRTVCRPLDRSRPLWRCVLVPDLVGGRAAVIVAFHHVLADGIGGLAVLASLVDGAAPSPADPAGGAPFPRPAPGTGTLLADAARHRLSLLTHPLPALRRLRAAIVQLRPAAGEPLARTSLNTPTGASRRLLTCEVPLEPLHRAARSRSATINDVLLLSISGALRELLERRGEHPAELVISVPMSARREASASALGNEVGAVPIRVPLAGPTEQRLEQIARLTSEARSTTRAASTAVIGPLFRALARLGIFGWFVDHQRLVHTFVTNLRGPESALSLLGVPIRAVHASAMITGNVTVSFAALSYAGSMGVTLVADPDACPDVEELRDLLHAQLSSICSL